jgi:hypothetical protein
MDRPSVTVAVVMRRERRPNRWEDWRFSVADVMADEGDFGSAPRTLRDDGRETLTLHPGFEVALFRDEGEGYHLNLVSGAPVWFVMWRPGEDDPSLATPQAVTLSYNEAARWLDAQERVDNVALPAEVSDWLAQYTREHYKPEPKQRKRPASFQRPEERR